MICIQDGVFRVPCLLVMFFFVVVVVVFLFFFLVVFFFYVIFRERPPLVASEITPGQRHPIHVWDHGRMCLLMSGISG